MPRGQTRSVKRETRLARQCAAKRFAASEHGRPLGTETDRFAELFKIFRLQLFAFEQSLHVPCNQASLLKRELRCSVQRRIGFCGLRR